MSDTGPKPDITTVAEELLEDLAKAKAKGGPLDVPGGLLGALYRIRVFTEWLSDRTGALAKTLVWVVFILGFFNVLTRYGARFVQRDIIVGEVFDLQWMIFGAMVLLGLNYGVLEGVNPRIDFWWTNFSLKKKAWIDLVIHTFFFIPFIVMSIGILWPNSMSAMGRSFDGTWRTWRVWEIWEQSTDAGGLPRGPIKFIMLVGFVLLATQVVAEIVKQVLVLANRDDLAGLREHVVPLRVE